MRIGPFRFVDPFDLPELAGFFLFISYVLCALAASCAIVGGFVWLALRLDLQFLMFAPLLAPIWVVWRYGVKR